MFGGGGSFRSGMQSPTGAEAKQRFAGTHSQAELGNDNGRQRRQDESERRSGASRDAFPSGAWERQRDDRGNLRRQRGGTPMGTHDRMSEGIPDVFIPPTMIGNAGVRGGRNENSGMTTGDAPGSESQGDVWRGWIGAEAKRHFAGRIPKRRLGTTAGNGGDRGRWNDGNYACGRPLSFTTTARRFAGTRRTKMPFFSANSRTSSSIVAPATAP